MSQVDRETAVPLDPTTEAVELRKRLTEFQPALLRRLGELGRTGATPDEKLALGVMREHMAAVSTLAQAAVAAISEADIPLREESAEVLSDEDVRVRDAVRDFANANGIGFTVRDLKAFLREEGIEFPSGSNFQAAFKKWQQWVLAASKEAGERRLWYRPDDSRTYVLAWREAPASQAAPHAQEPEPAAKTEPKLRRGRPQPSSRRPAAAPAEPASMPESQSSVASALGPEVELEPGRPPRALRIVPAPVPEEDPVQVAALRLVREAPEDPANILVTRLLGIEELNLSLSAAREVFKKLAASGRLHRTNGGGRVYYSIEPPEPRAEGVSQGVTEAETETTEPSKVQQLVGQHILSVLSGKGVPFGKAFTPAELVRMIEESTNSTGLTTDDVKAAAKHLQDLGLLGRTQQRGKRTEVMKLRLTERSVMDGLKSPAERASIMRSVVEGRAYVLPPEPVRRRPAKKKL